MEVPDPHSSSPDRPLPPPPTFGELLEVFRLRVEQRYPWLDPTRVVLAVTALVALGGMAWAVLVAGPGSSRTSKPVMRVTPTTSARASTLVPSTTVPSELVVDAAGALRKPGLVRVRSGARVDDVIRAAGGADADADLERVDRAMRVSDGQRVYIPRIGQTEVPAVVDQGGSTPGSSTASPGAPGPVSGPIDVNTATAADLEALPGVGPATAQAIIAYRTRNGPFASVEDLMNVRGIGPAKLSSLRPHVTV